MHRLFSVWSYRNVSVTREPTAVLKTPTGEGTRQHNEWKTSGKIAQWNCRPKTITVVQNSHLSMKYKMHSPGQVVAQSSNKRCTDRCVTGNQNVWKSKNKSASCLVCERHAALSLFEDWLYPRYTGDSLTTWPVEMKTTQQLRQQ